MTLASGPGWQENSGAQQTRRDYDEYQRQLHLLDKSAWVPTDAFLREHCLDCGKKMKAVAYHDMQNGLI
jgi:hypothetical protein